MRKKHDAAKAKQKEYADHRRRAKEKVINVGDEVLVQQKKSSVKTPWDPVPFKGTEVKGSKLKVQKGELVRERAKNNVKLLKPRLEELKIRTYKRVKVVEDIDLDVDLEKIRVQEQPEQPGGEEQQGEEQAESEEQSNSEEFSEEEDKKNQRPIRKRQPP